MRTYIRPGPPAGYFQRGGERISGFGAAISCQQTLAHRKGGKCGPYQEERIPREKVQEHRPANHAVLSQDLSDQHSHDRSKELVPRVPQQVQQLALPIAIAYAQQVRAELHDGDLEDHDHERSGRRLRQLLRMEISGNARDERVEEDVGDDGHDGDVEVRRIDVFARREVVVL